MSHKSDRLFIDKLLQLIQEHGTDSHKLMKKFSVDWMTDDDGAIEPAGYSIEWKWKDEIRIKKSNVLKSNPQ